VEAVVLSPRDAERLAAELERLDVERKRAVAAWLAAGGELESSAAEMVTLAARSQQLIYRALIENPDVVRRVTERLPPSLARAVGAHVKVGRRLRSLVTPVESVAAIDVAAPRAPCELRRLCAEAEAVYEVPWEVLAAINFTESRFGRLLGPSSAGALGPMQFLPLTWAKYGDGGDVMDPRDSILAAARYLKQLGALDDLRKALFAYNRSETYVDAILTYAHEMRADESAFYSFYFWRVFIATPTGDVAIA
jgi:soluble lytic murein transglycosylase-like protein